MSRKRFTGIIVAFMLAFTILLAAVPEAFAGSNGQQIYFSCSSGIQGVSAMDYAIIRGKNQSNNDMEWSGNATWSGDRWSTFVFSSGYWWVGQVRIYWWNARTNSWSSGTYNVPREQQGNITYLNC